MMEVNSLLFMAVWELVLVLIAIDVVIILRTIIRRRRERASIERLVATVKNESERRKQETRNFLEKQYGYSGEQLDKTAKIITQEEKRIYETIANLFMTRDTTAIENLGITFEEAVEPYRNLEVSSASEEEATTNSGTDESEELKRLRKENKLLSDEMGITMDKLSRMLSEYSTMYDSTDEAGLDKEKSGESVQTKSDSVVAKAPESETSETTLEITLENEPDESLDATSEEAIEGTEEEGTKSSLGGFVEDVTDESPKQDAAAAPQEDVGEEIEAAPQEPPEEDLETALEEVLEEDKEAPQEENPEDNTETASEENQEEGAEVTQRETPEEDVETALEEASEVATESAPDAIIEEPKDETPDEGLKETKDEPVKETSELDAAEAREPESQDPANEETSPSEKS